MENLKENKIRRRLFSWYNWVASLASKRDWLRSALFRQRFHLGRWWTLLDYADQMSNKTVCAGISSFSFPQAIFDFAIFSFLSHLLGSSLRQKGTHSDWLSDVSFVSCIFSSTRPYMRSFFFLLRLFFFVFVVCSYITQFSLVNNGDGWVAFVQRKQHQRLLPLPSVIFLVTEKESQRDPLYKNHALLSFCNILSFVNAMDIFRVIPWLFFSSYISFTLFFLSFRHLDLFVFLLLFNLHTVFFFFFFYLFLFLVVSRVPGFSGEPDRFPRDECQRES